MKSRVVRIIEIRSAIALEDRRCFGWHLWSIVRYTLAAHVRPSIWLEEYKLVLDIYHENGLLRGIYLLISRRYNTVSGFSELTFVFVRLSWSSFFIRIMEEVSVSSAAKSISLRSYILQLANFQSWLPMNIRYVNYNINEIWTDLITWDIDGWPICCDIYLTDNIKQERLMYVRGLYQIRHRKCLHPQDYSVNPVKYAIVVSTSE